MNTFALCLTLLSIFSIISTASGSYNTVSITDEAELANLSRKVSFYLEEINKKGGKEQLELVRFHSATLQLASGQLYKMYAEINENNTPVDCDIGLWERPWQNFVRMVVVCGEEERTYAYQSE